MTPFDQDALDLAEGSMEPAAALLKQYKTILDGDCDTECCVTNFIPASLWDDISKSGLSNHLPAFYA